MRKNVRLMIIFIIMLMLVSVSFKTDAEAGGGRRFTMSQAVTLAVAKSRDYKSTRSKIFLKQAEYENAIKAIALKKKNMSTFRWTPLLSFKFPEKAALADEYEYTYKPLQIQSEISALKHKLNDIKYSVREEVSNLYVDIYTCQEFIKYKKNQLSSTEEALKKNKAKLAAGMALQADIAAQEAAIKSLNEELALKERELQRGKEEMSKLTGIDVTVGYEFSNPYKETAIGREYLEYIKKQTLQKSQTYYEAKLNAQLALTALNTNYSLMKNQYGGKMNYISSFVAMAKSGQEIDSAEFKLYYGRFLKAIDDPWQGKKRILFIRIPKEWFKGSIDGVRYVEDDPYALYTSVLEYQEAEEERKQTENDILKQVEESFENMVTARNSYQTISRQAASAYQDMEKGRIKNKAGELTFSEYEELKKDYEDMELEKLEALGTYSQILYSFDRLSCGTITELLTQADLVSGAGQGGESFVTENMLEGAYYYINTIVEDNAFEIGIYIPEDCEVSVNKFELWVDNVMLGERTEVGSVIRHLTLSVEAEENTFLRLYDDNKFIADVPIDTSKYRGELPIEVKKKQEESVRNIGSFKYEKNEKTKAVTLKLMLNEAEGIGYFRLSKDGKYILSEEPLEASGEITYLSLIEEDISGLKAEFYDKNKDKLGEGYLNSDNMSVFLRISED